MPDSIGELRFPTRGIDLSDEVSGQPPLTTPVGVNVRVYESIAFRARGGSRPGTLPIPPGLIPEGAVLIQHLNTVITTDPNAVPVTVPEYPNPVFPNPSTPGDPAYWGFYPDGSPRTTRSPQDGFPPGGTGYQPPKNGRQTHHLTIYGPSGSKFVSDTVTWTPGEPFFTGFLAPSDTLVATYASAGDAAGSPAGTYPVNVTPTLTSNTGDTYIIDRIVPGTLLVDPDPPPTFKYCWGGQITAVITKPFPDPFGWNGQVTSNVGVTCSSAQPGTALAAKIVIPSDGLPVGSTVQAALARFLLNHVGSDAYATIQTDQVSPAHSVGVCTTDDGTCTGIISATQPASPGSVGVIVGAG